jgi:hypothetical protein
MVENGQRRRPIARFGDGQGREANGDAAVTFDPPAEVVGLMLRPSDQHAEAVQRLAPLASSWERGRR